MELCPNCKHPKERKDFYWRRYAPNRKVYRDCIDCVTARINLSNQIKASSRGDYLYGYFN